MTVEELIDKQREQLKQFSKKKLIDIIIKLEIEISKGVTDGSGKTH